MTLTPTSLLSCVISSMLLTVLAWMVIKNDSVLKTAGKYICIFLMLVVVRMLLPVEFGFTVTLLSRRMLTGLRNMMLLEVTFGALQVTVGQVLLFLWIIGAVCRFCICTGRHIYFMHKVEESPGYFKHDVKAVTDRINREFGKEGKFKVLFVPGVQTPAIIGVTHPVILMPGVDYTEREIYYILKHEMMHFYHHDMLVKIICEALCIIYWWNPAVFLLEKLIVRVQELRVDGLIISGRSEEEKTDYLECIARSMRVGKQERTSLMITFVSQRGQAMRQRIRFICGGYWTKTGWKGIYAAIISCLLFTASVSVIVEPDYGEDIPGTFSYPDPQTSYLIETDGYYEIYIDGEFVGKVREITEPITELKIYKNEEELTNEE